MSAQIIPRNQWMEFFRWFSQGHRRWLVTARWRERLTSVRLLVQNAPLEHIVVSLVPRHPRPVFDIDRVWLVFAHDLRQIPRHELLGPAEIRFYHEEEADRLELELLGGAVLALSLRPAEVSDERLPVF